MHRGPPLLMPQGSFHPQQVLPAATEQLTTHKRQQSQAAQGHPHATAATGNHHQVPQGERRWPSVAVSDQRACHKDTMLSCVGAGQGCPSCQEHAQACADLTQPGPRFSTHQP